MTGSRKTHHARHGSCDSNSDSSNHHKKPEIECYSNEKPKQCKPKHHNKSEESCSSSSSSEQDIKCDMPQVYQYFKNKILCDEQLMVAGSNSYIFAGNKVNQMIPINHTLQFGNNYTSLNLEKTHSYSPFYVRESGVYLIVVCISTDNSSQFTIFVNGIVQPLTTIGTNSGAGQVVSRHLLQLNKDDNIVIRNYVSPNTVYSQTNAGGLLVGNNLIAVIMKVAPHTAPKKQYDKIKCLSHKKLRLFKKLTKMLVCDNDLMLKGFNITGSFYNNTSQVVNTETDVVFNLLQNVNGLQWNPTGVNPEQVKVLDDGVYKLFYCCNTHTPVQFSFCVNGVPNEDTTTGTNKGAGQVSLRALLELKQNDIVTVRNHTSANGSITISDHAGGSEQSVSSILTMFKISNLVKPCVKPVDLCIEKKYDCYYELFKNYLLCNKMLQVCGSEAYVSMTGSSEQEIVINDSLSYSTNILVKDMIHQQGNKNVIVKKSGLYDLFIDTITNEPDQWTLFVNGVPDLSVVFGRESGAARTLIRQLVKFKKGDSVEIKNHTSHAGTVNTSVNPGGSYVGNNKQFVLFLLTLDCHP
jgi:hypothetical protein